jgi:uncharacterized protein (UPF0548 family)
MFVWFSRDVSLKDLLEQWQSSESNYQPNQPMDASWHVDGYERVLSPQPDDALFERAVAALFRNRFFPPHVLTFYADFTEQDREMRIGDRIIQRIPILPNVLELITMNRVTDMFFEPDRRGFTYFTTVYHVEIGEWTAGVVRKKTGQIALMVHTISKVDPGRVPWLLRPIARWLQLRAHRLGLAHFQKLVEVQP